MDDIKEEITYCENCKKPLRYDFEIEEGICEECLIKIKEN